ncbi:class I SAM-dependent methyltransferase [Bifidobacterium simiarum]|uniref:class I SAM-dependent methyltransferase n=1 Tax=Bifidobacterium simiarum TaxID=2045441 RepID=UPI001BDD6089|nr:class I SAM-dependent methyltransferase [Bifidobacterium simiarum]MBT1166662.1 class I SAM-dependent methyltransferase [Bifidobacterium simiarum]
MPKSTVVDYFAGNENLLDDSAKRSPNITQSRFRLLHTALTVTDPGRVLSIGMGSGIAEEKLRDEYGINVVKGVEPSEGFAALARKRGFEVEVAGAQEVDYEPDAYDTIVYNGSSFGFLNDDELKDTWRRNYEALSAHGKLVFTDVPKESALGAVLYLTQRYPEIKDDDFQDLLEGTTFYRTGRDEYKPYWHLTEWYVDLLRSLGFREFRFFQTVLANPPYQEQAVEDPIEGYKKGNYIAVVALK